MSLSPTILKNDILGLREKVRFEWNIHRHRILVGAIMTTVSFAIAMALTGDFNEAYSRSVRR
jgi:hypothetical protein